MNKWINKWMNEWMNEWINKMNELIKWMNTYTNKKVYIYDPSANLDVVVDFKVQLSMQPSSANVNLKPLKTIVNHMVENSLQDYQAQAEDVKVSGEADLCILAGICWHIVTCVLCKAGKRTPSGPLFSTSNLQTSQTCICLLVEEITFTTQLLIRLRSKFRPQWNRWQWHCHYLVQKRSKNHD